MRTLVLATGNTHKTAEVRAILGDSFQVYSMADFPGAPKPEEHADSFGGNALIKAVELAAWLAEQQVSLPPGTAILADDSGLEVRALAWAPGVHSARFAALDTGQPGNSADADNNAKLLRLLGALPEASRVARFRCVLALLGFIPVSAATDGNSLRGLLAAQAVFFEGTCDGRIAAAGSGKGGFGYDPLFIPDGQFASFADLGESLKNQISHRARALRQLEQSLKKAAPVP